MAALLGGAAAAVLLAGSPATALDAGVEQKQIGNALQAGYGRGYAAKDAASILALYDQQARIVTFTAGSVDKAAFGALLGGIFQGWSTAEAKVALEKPVFIGENEARVTFQLQVSGTNGAGKPMVRQDRWHALLRREGAGWVILKQSYREDLGVSATPHDEKHGGAAPPAASGRGGVWH